MHLNVWYACAFILLSTVPHAGGRACSEMSSHDDDDDHLDVSLIALQKALEEPELAEIDSDANRQHRKMAAGIDLDDSPNGPKPLDATATKRKRIDPKIVEGILTSSQTPTSRNERMAAEALEADGFANLDDDDDDDARAEDFRTLDVLEDKLSHETDKSRIESLSQRIHTVKDRIARHTTLDMTTQNFVTTNDTLVKMLKLHSTASLEEREQLIMEIRAIHEIQVAQRRVLNAKHREVLSSTGASYWMQDLTAVFYGDNANYQWMTIASHKASPSYLATEPDMLAIVENVLGANQAEGNKQALFTLSKRDATMLRKLMTRKNVGMQKIIEHAIAGSGHPAMRTMKHIHKHLASAERAYQSRNDANEIGHKWEATVLFVNVIHRLLVDIRHFDATKFVPDDTSAKATRRLMSDKQLRWRYTEARNASSESSPLRELHKALAFFFSNMPLGDSVDNFLADMLTAKILAIKWIPSAVSRQAHLFITRLTAINKRATVVKALKGASLNIEDTSYFQSLAAIQISMLSDSGLLDKDSYLTNLRKTKAVTRFRAATALVSPSGEKLLNLKKRVFSRSLIDDASPHAFLVLLARTVGIFSYGYIEHVITVVTDAINDEWRSEFAKRITSMRLFNANITPGMVRDIFGDDHKELTAHMARMEQRQSEAVQKLRNEAASMSDTSNARENKAMLRAMARKYLGQTTTTEAEAETFLKRFNIAPATYGLREKRGRRRLDNEPQRKASLHTMAINNQYRLLFNHIRTYDDAAARHARIAEIMERAKLPIDWLDKTRAEIDRSNRYRSSTATPDEIEAASFFTTTAEEVATIANILSAPKLNDELRKQISTIMHMIIMDGDGFVYDSDRFESVRQAVIDASQEPDLYVNVTYEWYKGDDKDMDLRYGDIGKLNTAMRNWRIHNRHQGDVERNQLLREKVVGIIANATEDRIEFYNEVLKQLANDHNYPSIGRWLSSTDAVLPNGLMDDINEAFSKHINVSEPTKPAIIFDFTDDIGGDDDEEEEEEEEDEEEDDEDDDVPLLQKFAKKAKEPEMPPPRIEDNDDDFLAHGGDSNGDDLFNTDSEDDDDTLPPSFEKHEPLLLDDEDSLPSAQLAHPDLLEQYEDEMNQIYMGDGEVIDVDAVDIDGDGTPDIAVAVYNLVSSDEEEEDGTSYDSNSVQDLINSALAQTRKNRGSIVERRRLMDTLRPTVVKMLMDRDMFPLGIDSIKQQLALQHYDFGPILSNDASVTSIELLKVLETSIAAYQDRKDTDDDESYDSDDALMGDILNMIGQAPAVRHTASYYDNSLIV